MLTVPVVEGLPKGQWHWIELIMGNVEVKLGLSASLHLYLDPCSGLTNALSG
jgi:hypothetical protein